MLLVASETGHVYTFATRKLQPMITSENGKALIQTCLNSPDLLPINHSSVELPSPQLPSNVSIRSTESINNQVISSIPSSASTLDGSTGVLAIAEKKDASSQKVLKLLCSEASFLHVPTGYLSILPVAIVFVFVNYMKFSY
jgi:hypothetical protein